jgi:hypothetical protein
VTSVFRATLRNRVERVQEALVEARQAGHDYEAELHGEHHDCVIAPELGDRRCRVIGPAGWW